MDLVAFLERQCCLMVSAGAWESKGPGSFTYKLWANFSASLNFSVLPHGEQVNLSLYILSTKMATCFYVK